MSNALIVKNDGWDSVPSRSGDLIPGRRVKFNGDGDFVVDKDITKKLNGATLVVLGVRTVWVHFAGGKLVEARVTAPGCRHPDRDELPDLDPSRWEIAFGQPSDPWRDSRYLDLIDRTTAQMFTFVTDTAGGRKAIGDLKNQIAAVRVGAPGAVPVVRLESEKWSTRFGLRPKPLFRVVEWIRGDVETGSAPTPAPQITHASASEQPAPRDALNDEIPF
jgi:hypothetical protein